MRRRFLLAALTALAMSAAAGCGTDRGATARRQQAGPASGVSSVAATPRAGVRDGGQFVWTISQIPPNFNFHEIDGLLAATDRIMGAVLPRFFDIDAAGNATWNRDYLAAEPGLKTAPTQVVTFTINPKAIWSDGSPITWQDLLWQWKASNGTDKEYKIASSTGWTDIKGVARGRDDRQAVVTFKNRYADWRPLFTSLYPKSTNQNPKVFNDGWAGRILTTAGPFKFDALDKTAQTISLIRNEKWWGDRAKLDKISFRAVDDTAAADALANGEVDFIDVGANVNRYDRAKTLTGKIDLRRAGGPNFRHITMNASHPQLSDKAVRQALAEAIDRTTIARAMLQPLDIDPVPLNNHIYMTNHDAYRDNAGPVGIYDPGKAGAALDAAGWKLDGTVRKKSGTALKIDIVIPAGVQANKQEAGLIQAMLTKVGVVATVRPVPPPDFFDKYITPGDFDFTVFSWLGVAFPISANESIYRKPVSDGKGDLRIEQNYARVGSTAIDEAFQAGDGELDRTKQEALGNKLDALLWDEAGVIPMYQRPDIAAVRTDIVNFGAFGYATVAYEDIGFKK